MLCEECRDELASPLRIGSEQVQAHGHAPADAALIDRWGRPHRLDARTTVGRQLDDPEDGEGRILLLDASVSRHHARLVQDAERQWHVEDLQSSNGSFVNDAPISGAVALTTGDRLAFSDLGFYFLAHLPEGCSMAVDAQAVTTIPSQGRVRFDSAAANDFAQPERTDAGLPQLDVRLSEPTGGGGGLVEADGRQVQLTATQYQLISLLIQRMLDEPQQPDLVRGFVRTSELVADLSWDTRHPGDAHVKQLVRRVRRALIKAELGDLIDSRPGFGYRLRAVPNLLK